MVPRGWLREDLSAIPGPAVEELKGGKSQKVEFGEDVLTDFQLHQITDVAVLGELLENSSVDDALGRGVIAFSRSVFPLKDTPGKEELSGEVCVSDSGSEPPLLLDSTVDESEVESTKGVPLLNTTTDSSPEDSAFIRRVGMSSAGGVCVLDAHVAIINAKKSGG